jgi:Trypsin-co-occurring domain 1
MAQLIEFLTETGDKVFVEVVSPSEMQPLATDGSDVIKKASQTFESAIATVKHAAAALLESAGKISLPADKIEMELGIKASAKAGFYLASADSQAQIKIKLVWSKKREAPATP